MKDMALAIIPVFLLLLASEYLWRIRKVRGEAARKLVHIAVGSYVAFWPWFLSNREIMLLSAAFLVVVGFSQVFNVFKAIHGSGHRRLGEVLFAVSIGLTALLTTNEWVFAVAILHLSLADGFAGLVGTKWGKGNFYKVLGQRKSFVGTSTFLVASVLILLLAFAASPSLTQSHILVLAVVPLAAAAAENFGIWSTDNVMVPLVVTGLLSIL